MTSDQSLRASAVDLEALADTLSDALAAHPGVVRLEPTVRSVIDRWTPAAIDQMHRTLRPAARPPVVARDGLVLSMTDLVLTLQIDLATDIRRSALELAQEAQDLAGRLVQDAGLTIGSIDVTILAIEGARTP
ncbi:hypothetical protein [Arthrobacter agilis]|uniref:hypothetical protein n=1 Tax=Arthrobacter agilis TaxID=37921 RepID=UPI001ABF923A|nr:hypothetical protein [Arthrobacter agilis]